jgi:hypothetical protein
MEPGLPGTEVGQMVWWVRREQWPHMEFGPFGTREDAEALHAQLTPELFAAMGGAEWTWAVVPGGWAGSAPFSKGNRA